LVHPVYVRIMYRALSVLPHARYIGQYERAFSC